MNTPGVSVHDGFPNPGTDTSLQPLDLTNLLIKNSVSTFLMRVSGNDWQAEGVFNNDIAIVDRALSPRRNDLVSWWLHDSFVISRYHQMPQDAVCRGVISAIIHLYRDAT